MASRSGLFPGYDLRRPVAAAVEREPTARPTTRELQQQLVDLGFMATSGLTGTVDLQTSTAVLGFQKWASLGRDGTLGAATVEALLARDPPRAGADGPRAGGSRCSFAARSRC